MKAIAYARFSPRRSGRDAIPKQMEDIYAWAEREGHEIVLCCFDTDISGNSKMWDRPGLTLALRSLTKGMLLIARNQDRLGRGVVGLLIEEHVRETKAHLAAIESGGLVGMGRSERLARGIMYLVGDYQREEMNERTSRRMQHHKRNGRRMSRHAPWGYQFDGESLVPNPEETKALERMRELSEKGVGTRKIARMLAREGYRPRGDSWHHGSISRLINSSVEES